MDEENKTVEAGKTYSTLTGKMEYSGQDMFQCSCGVYRYYKETPGRAWQHDVTYHGACGYCKYDPCKCGGHGE